MTTLAKDVDAVIVAAAVCCLLTLFLAVRHVIIIYVSVWDLSVNSRGNESTLESPGGRNRCHLSAIGINV